MNHLAVNLLQEMPNKCCVYGCTSNYGGRQYTKSYSFPNDSDEKCKWKSCLPNAVNVTRNTKVCSKHWPENMETIVVNRHRRPKYPPSIFFTIDGKLLPKSVNSSLFTTTSRDVEKRGVTAEKRRKLDSCDKNDVMIDCDKVTTFDNFKDHKHLQDLIKKYQLAYLLQVDQISLFKVNGNEILSSVTIFSDFHIQLFHRYKKVTMRDLLGFQLKLERWSKLEAILMRLSEQGAAVDDEINWLLQRLTMLAESMEDDKIKFLVDQMKLCVIKGQGRRYSSATIIKSTRIYLCSRIAYNVCRNILCLPHPDTLKKYFGGFGAIGSYDDCKSVLNSYFQRTDVERKCYVIFDEMYVKPSLRYRGNHLLGIAEDDQSQLARTMLAIMLKPLFKTRSFMVRLIPIYKLSPEFLYSSLSTVYSLVREVGGEVIAFISDNHRTNRTCYELMSSNAVYKDVILLHDPVHVMKSIRNNWISEKNQTISILFDDVYKAGKWHDIVHVYNQEKDLTIRMTRLTTRSLYPTAIERQKVSLLENVFCDKVVAALRLYKCDNTANFLEIFTTFWKILKIKSFDEHIRMNDNMRRPIIKLDDRLKFLQSLKCSIENMAGGHGVSRNHCFTSETKYAFMQTVVGLINIIGKIHALGYDKVLTGHINSDDLEGEFGVFRQMSGGTYYVAVEQVIYSNCLRRMNFNLSLLEQHDTNLILSKNSSTAANAHFSECCQKSLQDDELDLLDDRVMEGMLTESENCSLCFVAGYLAFKESIECGFDIQLCDCKDSAFINLLSRGKLKIPPQWLFAYVCESYHMFKHGDFRCSMRFQRLCMLLYDSLYVHYYSDGSTLTRRMSNCFFKGLCFYHSDGDTQNASDRCLRKLCN